MGFIMLPEEIVEKKIKVIKTAAIETAQIKPNSKVLPKKEIKDLKRKLCLIRDTYKELIYTKKEITPGFEWLYDNYYVLEREGRSVIKELSDGCLLPSYNKKPLVMLHAENFCKAAIGTITCETIEYYIEEAQKIRPFDTCELCAINLFLRATLIGEAALACRSSISDDQRRKLFSDAIKTLGFLNTFDFCEIIEHQSIIEKILSEDPSKIYLNMDEKTRSYYRHRVELIAKKSNISEVAVAKKAIELAKSGKTAKQQHVGFYLINQNLNIKKNSARGKIYLSLLWTLPLIISIIAAVFLKTWWLIFILYIPLWEVFKPLVELFVVKGVEPTFIPRMDVKGVIPNNAETLVVVSALLTSPSKVSYYIKKIQQFYYSNGQGKISFALLCDLKEDKFPTKPEDEAIINKAISSISSLNNKYGNHFALFIRERKYSKTQDCFSGWERKRGAIIELIRFINQKETSIKTFVGDKNEILKTKFLIALDSDTGLVMDSASEMISSAIHPLNIPEVENGKVTSGYGILSPKINVDIDSASLTPFSRIMAGAGGVTAYDSTSNDIWQDIFDESIFCGKGIINVKVFYEVLDKALPENRILSHDIIEGCYLRVGYLSNVELTDGFPSKPSTWFSRLNRWIRGDFQNIPFIFNRKNSSSSISSLNRFHLFDNLRRAITPVFSFALLIIAAFTPLYSSIILIIISFLAVTSGNLLSALISIIYGGPSMLSRKYHCRVLPNTIDSLAQTALSWLFLPEHALVSLDAQIKAITRLISHKNMLEWTTAAETEQNKKHIDNNFETTFKRFIFTFFVGLILVILSPSIAVKIASAFFLISPLIAFLSAIPSKPIKDNLTSEDTSKLLSYTAAMWNFYETFATAKENFLPPDNYQEAPVSVVAHRTSPTNIGLMLLSILSARDLNLIDSAALYSKVEKTISTVEKLEKWHGHLLNWYSTETLSPILPRYISTVDSGNFVCCLVALKEGLKDYQFETPTGNISERIQSLIDNTDLSVLYNSKRKLFHLGYDLEKNELSTIYYDMLMSEARMTSYFAVAKRIAPKNHWGALSRTLTKHNGYTGPISWTGTMFEYLMPHLLLPVYEDSMAAEALRFVIYCQKKRARSRKVPWGISESGFYSFDADLNYQYEANGVQLLALKRGMDNNLVISPYSTFLALPFDRIQSMNNLRRLDQMGIYGSFGFYEAADFTYSRTGGKMAIVKSFMAHHIGMSIVSANNAINDGIMQERFLRNKEMRSARDLLLEKIPADATIFKDVVKKNEPEKPPRYVEPKEDFSDVSPFSPRINTISNGEYTMILSDCGVSFSIYHTLDVIQRNEDILRFPTGIFALCSFSSTILSVTKAPKYYDRVSVKRRVGFNDSGAIYYAREKDYAISMIAMLSSESPTELRAIEVENYSQKRIPISLLIYFEPALAKYNDVIAHPAFSRLFLSVEYRKDIKALIFERRVRGDEISASIVVGFEELDIDFEFEGDRASILKRPDGVASLENSFDTKFSNSFGALTDAAAAIRVTTELSPKSRKKFTLILSVAPTAQEAVSKFVHERRRGLKNILKNAATKNSQMVETRLSSLILPQILYPVCDTVSAIKDEAQDLIKNAVIENRLPKNSLWQLGISGDYPIVLLRYSSENDLEFLEPYVRTRRLLSLQGINFELVITYRESGDYERSDFDKIKRCIRNCGCEFLLSCRGGIHLVNLERFPQEIENLLISSACHIALKTIKPVFIPFRAIELKSTYPVWKKEEELPTFAGGFCDNSFVVNHIAQSPIAPWSHIIASPTFGTLVSDRALGFSWALNSRENKLTPWSNDTAADNKGEMLIVKLGFNYYDLIKNARASFSPSKAVFESEQNDLNFIVTVTIDEKFMAKVVTVEIENEKSVDAQLEIAYYTEPILSVNSQVSRHIDMTFKNGVAVVRNPWAEIQGFSYLTAFDETSKFIKSKSDFFSGNFAGNSKKFTPNPCAALIVKRKLPPKRKEKITFILGFSKDYNSISKSVELLKSKQPTTPLLVDTSSIQIDTKDKALNEMINTWLPNQFISSRIFGRTGFYQCGGAYGFRDQLQDCCASIFIDSRITRTHIYRCCAHQFKEGDVMHWWHQLPNSDGGSKGVRTKCSDDLLWLCYTVCEYLEKTGDYSIFEHDIYYLDGEELKENEHDRYFVPTRSSEKDNVYKHCLRAIKRSLTTGEHGIPLIGNGDWNDGMNLIGVGGKGESVWLAMFEVLVFTKFIPIATHENDLLTVELLNKETSRLKSAIDKNCWDGDRYIRAFFDDGSPLGVKENDECRIDLLPQSFATIANLPDIDRRKEALESVKTHLVDKDLKLVKLFDPPFDNSKKNPGYIKSYAKGIRENGGQYTHAAVWSALAFLMDGQAEMGYKILSWINPINRNLNLDDAKTYRLEPFSITADISTNKAAMGRGGWSLYTGAAGWYYRTVIEYYLGIKISSDKIEISPCLVNDWDGYNAIVNWQGSKITIEVKKGERKGLYVDSKPDKAIMLDGKDHIATYIL